MHSLLNLIKNNLCTSDLELTAGQNLTSIQYFLEQDYPYKELVIIDDSSQSAVSYIPNFYSIRYFYLQQKISVGTKRNKAREKAAGSIIIHWDDDDWYAPDWVSYHVDCLLNSDGDICGLSTVQYYSQNTHHTYFVTENDLIKKYGLSGATFAY